MDFGLVGLLICQLEKRGTFMTGAHKPFLVTLLKSRHGLVAGLMV